jgi:hypothetical protein
VPESNVTYHERSQRGDWDNITAKWSTSLAAMNVIASKRMMEQKLSCAAELLEAALETWRAGQALKNHL